MGRLGLECFNEGEHFLKGSLGVIVVVADQYTAMMAPCEKLWGRVQCFALNLLRKPYD
jgi:hypothetical protein